LSWYLLAAEVDKIQDFIFRSSRLREVVGGSQLLSRFCEEVPCGLLPAGAKVVVNAGGTFRILFSDAAQAETFGDQLAEVYHRATGCSLTVAKPVPVGDPIDEHFPRASEKTQEDLRWTKLQGHGWLSQDHLPYMAVCASCGVGLAVAHRAYVEDEKAQYVCRSCLNKSTERQIGRMGTFLEDFYKEVADGQDVTEFDWPGSQRKRRQSDALEDVAGFDPRHHVAYLLADGNAMGEVFGSCRSCEQMAKLSKELMVVVRKALAVPTRRISQNGFVPVLPLILGGDDLFALVPAPWALDFARCFCEAYEEKMTDLFEDVGLAGVVPRPTVSCAVVICKSKYPYALAHRTGEMRLTDAKRIGKLLSERGDSRSTVNFEVLKGGQAAHDLASPTVRATLRPYWVTDMDLSAWGLPVQRLIDQRWQLRAVPKKRLSELQNLYGETSLPASWDHDKLIPWQDGLERLLQRIAQRSEAYDKAIRSALTMLGEDEEKKEGGFWRRVERDSGEIWHGHGLPDLFELWDFSLELAKSPRDYGEE
jgi:hypothetical protein